MIRELAHSRVENARECANPVIMTRNRLPVAPRVHLAGPGLPTIRPGGAAEAHGPRGAKRSRSDAEGALEA
ncbi:hypothetical protein GCM10009559_08460 [Pseudonocardia zijingensis]|jgi:hypothetical protein|uniref:Uncharacterized protein n=1 Tax=Pseudonocardia zijingensis TaxID=153376 RepID=A0ABN1P933_9PSEU